MQQQHRAEQRRAAQGGRYCREGGGNCTPRGDDGTTVLRVPSPHSQRPVRGKRVPVSPVHKRRSQRALFPLVSPLCRASRCSTGGGGGLSSPPQRVPLGSQPAELRSPARCGRISEGAAWRQPRRRKAAAGPAAPSPQPEPRPPTARPRARSLLTAGPRLGGGLRPAGPGAAPLSPALTAGSRRTAPR